MARTPKLFGKKTQDVSPLTDARLEYLLDSAQPAEKTSVPNSCIGAGAEIAEFPHLNALESRDGVWVCCRGHENNLVHFKGAYPFKRLACTACDHVICRDCETTGMVVSVQDSEVPAIHHDDGSELRFFQVCPGCGLSYRVDFYAPSRRLMAKRICWVPTVSPIKAEACICGEAATFDWPKFFIGKPWEFRLNAAQKTHDCQMKSLQKRTKTANLESSRRPTFPNYSASSTLDPRRHRHRAATESLIRHTSSGVSTQQDLSRAITAETTSNCSGPYHNRRPALAHHLTIYQDQHVTTRRPLSTRAQTWVTAHEPADYAVEAFLGRR